jgi:hypothetical protein
MGSVGWFSEGDWIDDAAESVGELGGGCVGEDER